MVGRSGYTRIIKRRDFGEAAKTTWQVSDGRYMPRIAALEKRILGFG